MIASVLLPIRNGGPFVREMLDSVFSQTMSDFEVLVWDNGSTDDSLPRVKEVCDRRLRIIYSGPDVGLQKAWFALMREASGKYLVCPGADDVLYPDFLEHGVEEFGRHPTASLIHLGYKVFSDDVGRAKQDICGPPVPLRAYGKELLTQLLIHNFIKMPGALVRSSAAKQAVACAHSELRSAVDWYFWMLLAATGGEFVYSEAPRFAYRVHPEAMSQRKDAAALRAMEDRLAPLLGLIDAARISPQANELLVRFGDSMRLLTALRMVMHVRRCPGGREAYAQLHSGSNPFWDCLWNLGRVAMTLGHERRQRKRMIFPCSGYAFIASLLAKPA